MYSQGQEEKYITEYFAGRTGTLLSIGENDGKTLSNSLRLIQLGWYAILVEPAPIAFKKLRLLHKGNASVICINKAITETDGTFDFYDSGSHLGTGDTSLLSTTVQKEMERWPGQRNEFTARKVKGITYSSLIKEIGPKVFDFITIDAEGLDVAILKQIDLSATRMLCIEWNSNEDAKREIMAYCASHGMLRLQYQNGENLIIIR